MSTERPVEEWLALDDDELIRELSKMQPKPWKHERYTIKHAPGFDAEYACIKCGFAYSPGPDGGYWEEGPDCSVPDPLTIDWNTAMETYREIGPQRADTYLHQVWEILIEAPVDVNYMSYEMWKDEECQPKHYLSAAAMAAGRKEE